jgi:transposase
MDFHLDRLLNFPNVTIEKCISSDDTIELTLRNLNESIVCPHCGEEIDEIHQERPISVRDLSVFGKLTQLNLKRRQFYCQDCQRYSTEEIDYIDFDRHTTIRYQEYIYERVKVSTVSQVAKEEKSTYDRIQSIFREVHQRRGENKPKPKRISIDEFSHRKGRGIFATVVSDIDSGMLLEVIDSHQQKEIIEALLKWPLELREGVDEVSVDMWGGFAKVIKEVFPKAKIIFDRFHVMKKVIEELKQIMKECQKRVGKLKIRNWRYLLLKNGENLTEEEKELLERILQCSKRLREAYQLKEEFRQIYEKDQTVEVAKAEFEKWMEKAAQFYGNAIKMIKNHIDGICNYFISRTTSGVMEGINNKIKLIKRQAYGFTNFENLSTRLLAAFSY